MGRQLLFPDQVSPSLQAAVQRILHSQQSGAIPAAPDVFVRIGSLDRFLQNGKVLADAPLAGPDGPPVAFLTIPEGIAGFTSDAVLKRVGYTASEIAGLFHDSRAAVVVFRFSDAVRSLTSLDDDSSSSVLKRVVPSTWDNLFRSFKDLAAHEENPLHLNDDERQLVASFTLSGQLRLKSESYSQVKTEQGNDWRYRHLLQVHLWATPEFLGTGWTADENGGQGAPEYLGPNVTLSSLAAAQSLAILSL